MNENIHYVIASLAGTVIIGKTIIQNLSKGDVGPIYTVDGAGFGLILIVIGIYLISKLLLIKK